MNHLAKWGFDYKVPRKHDQLWQKLGGSDPDH